MKTEVYDNPLPTLTTKQLSRELMVIVPLTVGLTALSYRIFSVWWQIPVLLTLIPCLVVILRREPWAEIGFQRGLVRRGLLSLGRVSLIWIPLGVLGLSLARSWQWSLPESNLHDPRAWIYWILTQILYVALPEELFFRGYVQRRLHRILPKYHWRVILISAGLFGLAHVLTRGDYMTWLTPLPGLLMAWLYWRSQSLWASIVFHVLCNLTHEIVLSF